MIRRRREEGDVRVLVVDDVEITEFLDVYLAVGTTCGDLEEGD